MCFIVVVIFVSLWFVCFLVSYFNSMVVEEIMLVGFVMFKFVISGVELWVVCVIVICLFVLREGVNFKFFISLLVKFERILLYMFLVIMILKLVVWCMRWVVMVLIW